MSIKIHIDADGLAFGLDPHGVAQLGFGEGGRDPDLEACPVDFAFADRREVGPLSRRDLETDVAVGRDPFAVLDNLDPALLAFRIVIVEDEDRDRRRIEVFLGRHGPGRIGRLVGMPVHKSQDGENCDQEKNKGPAFHHRSSFP